MADTPKPKDTAATASSESYSIQTPLSPNFPEPYPKLSGLDNYMGELFRDTIPINYGADLTVKYYFPEGTPADKQIIRVNIATGAVPEPQNADGSVHYVDQTLESTYLYGRTFHSAPDKLPFRTPEAAGFYLRRNPELAEALREEVANGMGFYKMPIEPKHVDAIRESFESFGRTMGIKYEVGENLENADFIVAAYDTPNRANTQRLENAFSFGPPFPHVPGAQYYMMFNQAFLESASPAILKTTASHEISHTLGRGHPQQVYQHYSLTDSTTSMGVINYVPLPAGPGQAHIGAIDYSMRAYMPSAPALNTGDDDYHLLSLYSQSALDNIYSDPWMSTLNKIMAEGKYTQEDAITIMKLSDPARFPKALQVTIPAATVPIVDNGGRNTLTGTPSSDFIDTNPGYLTSSLIGHNTFNAYLAEGHIAEVHSMGGGDIVVADKGTQHIHMGDPGRSQNLVLLPHKTLGNTSVSTQGTHDLLAINGEALIGKQVDVRKEGADTVITVSNPDGSSAGSITLQNHTAGKGFATMDFLNAKADAPSYPPIDLSGDILAQIRATMQQAADTPQNAATPHGLPAGAQVKTR